MATKSGQKGRYICKVGFYDIYAKDSFKPKKDSKYNFTKVTLLSQELVIPKVNFFFLKLCILNQLNLFTKNINL